MQNRTLFSPWLRDDLKAALRLRAPILTGTSNIWIGQAPEKITARLDTIVDLGLDAVRVVVPVPPSDHNERRWHFFAEEASRRGIRALVGINPGEGAWERFPPERIEEVSRWWADRCGPWRYPGLVVGFTVYNEINLSAERVFMREANPEDGAAAARAHIAAYAAGLTHTATGFRDRWPGVTVVPGGLGGREVIGSRAGLPPGTFARAVVASYGPGLNSGLLDGLDTHWYRGEGDLDRHPDGTYTWPEDVEGLIDDLLAPIGRSSRDTRLFVTEANVVVDGFRDPADAEEAVIGFLTRLSQPPKMELVFPFTAFPNSRTRYRLVRGEPAGNGVMAWAQDPRGAGVVAPSGPAPRTRNTRGPR